MDVTRRWYAEHMPFPLNFFLPGRMQRQQLEKLRLLRGDERLEAGEELEKEVSARRGRRSEEIEPPLIYQLQNKTADRDQDDPDAIL